ncbi:MAG: hypothetical protein AAFQ79_01155 [Pseudomonadota bacterium]
MARRSSQEILASIERLTELVRVYEQWDDHYHGARPEPYDEMTIDWCIERLREEGIRNSGIEIGLKENLREIGEHILDIQRYVPHEAESFLAYYRERTGRDFWSDIENPHKAAKAIVRRGSIREESEFRLLMSILSDTEQTVFKGADVDRVNKLLLDFETRGKSNGD